MNRAMVLAVVLLACLCGGCAVVSVADAGVSVAANAVKVGANVVGGVSDVARAGVRVITNGVNQNR
jgi:hypothetical protein